ncbi:MAG: hypothetical protein E6H00_13035 [Bacillati bacterium ANGP1]|uniref:Uncharacterized protein n=1 Tax=Candidatus Segetimicrobium genomatis TaxID=2569760 RepID=A0A537JYL3_9BACT|nr:MAG: hypothetical protein E6H00_13035 [Terrabacteria group bacterium ANGP1]
MPYFAPPGGSLTARTARALQDAGMSGDLGILPTVNVRMPRAIPAALSQTRRFRTPPEETAMTGMGIVALPRYGRYPQPPAVTFAAARTGAARIRAAQASAQLHGLGAGHPAAGTHAVHFGTMPIVGGVRRQAAMFMSPGGGYSQIPGFMPAIGPPLRRLSFLGQEASTYNDLFYQDLFATPTPVTPTPTPSPFGDAPYTPADVMTFPYTPATTIQPSTYTAPTTLTPPGAGGAPFGVQYKPATFLPSVRPSVPFMLQAPLGVKTQYLIAAGVGIILLTVIAGKRRRNPARRKNPGRRRRRAR